MHVAEQPGEVRSCQTETGQRPVELLASSGVLGPRFVAVHATHLLPSEATLLGRAGAFVCINATTERDLGDGHPDIASLRAAGVRFCNGIDSHVMTDPFEEMRGLELGERLRTLRRITDRTTDPTLAARLWESASIEGARSLGFSDAGGEVILDRRAPALDLVEDHALLDALVFSCGPSLVRGVLAGLLSTSIASWFKARGGSSIAIGQGLHVAAAQLHRGARGNHRRTGWAHRRVVEALARELVRRPAAD
jgi:cytosine/adenosine deaminase-related metal-dependent hydrolase